VPERTARRQREQPAAVAPLGRVARDAPGRQLVVVIGDARTVAQLDYSSKNEDWLAAPPRPRSAGSV
jgi:hypothetical protein